MLTNRTLSLFLSLSAASVFVAAAADSHAQSKRTHRQIPSWYLGLNGAVNFVADSTVTERGGPSPQNGSIDFDAGYGMSAAIGYRPRYTNSFLDNMRFELEMGLLDNDINSFTVTGSGIEAFNGDVQSLRFMGNAFVDFNLSQQIRPYIGGGLGAARVFTENDEDTVFAYQGMVGLFYTPSSFPAAEFGAGYRYLALTDPQFTNTANANSQVEMEYDAHTLEAGVRLYF